LLLSMAQELDGGEHNAIQAVVLAGGFRVVHADETPANWTALIKLQNHLDTAPPDTKEYRRVRALEVHLR
jgi:hypothetical protein